MYDMRQDMQASSYTIAACHSMNLLIVRRALAVTIYQTFPSLRHFGIPKSEKKASSLSTYSYGTSVMYVIRTGTVTLLLKNAYTVLQLVLGCISPFYLPITSDLVIKWLTTARRTSCFKFSHSKTCFLRP